MRPTSDDKAYGGDWGVSAGPGEEIGVLRSVLLSRMHRVASQHKGVCNKSARTALFANGSRLLPLEIGSCNVTWDNECQ